MWRAFDEHIGLEHLHAVHVNDSKKGLGSRVDRHEHIGQGCIGEEAFGLFVRSSPVRGKPMFLETPKGTDPATGQDWDMQNLATLRRLAHTTHRPPLSPQAN
jgi:deoxyribonuclease-4